MEDFIKDKLSGYKPTFKENYWTEMSLDLKKRRRRRLLLFLLRGGLLAGVVVASLYVGIHLINQNSSDHSIARRPIDQLEHSPQSSSSSQQTATIKEDHHEALNAIEKSENEITQSESIDQINIDEHRDLNVVNKSQVTKNVPIHTGLKSSFENNSSTLERDSNIPVKNNKIIQSALSKSDQHPDRFISQSSTTANSNSSSSDPSISEPTAHDVQHAKNSTREGKVITTEDRAFIDEYNNVPLDAISLVDIKPIDRNLNFDVDPLTSSVTVRIKSRSFDLPKYGIMLAASVMSSSENSMVYGQQIQANRYFELDKSGSLYASAGIGVTHYHGNFDAIDHKKIPYKTFAQNSITQSLRPENIYTVGLTLETGIHASRWRVGIHIAPEWMISIDGNIETAEEITRVYALEAPGIPHGFSLENEVTSSSESARLEQTNIHTTTFSSGLSANYRLSQRWTLGLSGQYYFNGLFALKRTVLESNSLLGNNKIKGGLHVSYLF